jgi:hypothetical protein
MRPTPLTAAAVVLACCLLGAPPAGAAPPWRWPVAGPVITPYANGSDPYARGQHRGVDVAAPVGTPVVAASGGVVTFAGVAGSSGLVVGVRTDDGFDTSYLHLSSAAVRPGDRVAPGAAIGRVGISGRRSAAEPHLHFGVREAGTRFAYRDPLDFLPVPPPAPAAPEPAPVPVPVAAPASRPTLPHAVALGALPRAASLALPLPRTASLALPLGPPARSPLPAPPLAPVASLPSGRARALRISGRRLAGPSPERTAALARREHEGAASRRAHGGARAPVSATRGHAQLTVPRPSMGPSPAAANDPGGLGSGVRARRTARRTGAGIDIGWLAACIAMVATAAILARPRATTRSLRRTFGAALEGP